MKKYKELPFTGKYLKNKESGTYNCKNCNNPLFSSKTKFNSNTGWPSFFDIINLNSVELKKDTSRNLNRIEVIYKKCKSHLGHVFPDGPKPTNKRYCINSCSLDFKKDKIRKLSY